MIIINHNHIVSVVQKTESEKVVIISITNQCWHSDWDCNYHVY